MKALAFHFLYLRLMSVFQLEHVESNGEFTGQAPLALILPKLCAIDFNIEIN
jgi:hypothetical protein